MVTSSKGKHPTMSEADQQQTSEGFRLYEMYGKPFEAHHWGEFVAIAPDGRTLLAPTLLEAVQQAATELGPGNYVFKVGELVVGKWRRWPR
jgi:hypothetical protein